MTEIVTESSSITNAEEFIAAFERCEIDPASFHHREHVRLGWAYLEQHDLLDALGRFRTALKRFAEHAGATGLYHETITYAFLLLILDRRSKRPGLSWQEFEEAHVELFAWEPSILERHYREETLRSELARSTFLFPDL
jgi:hypothetical protein